MTGPTAPPPCLQSARACAHGGGRAGSACGALSRDLGFPAPAARLSGFPLGRDCLGSGHLRLKESSLRRTNSSGVLRPESSGQQLRAREAGRAERG